MAETTTQAPPILNSFCWFELNTREVEGVKKFYNKVFGWTTSPSQNPQMKYEHWHDKSGAMFGGIMDMNDPMWGEIPSHWMTYVLVEDIDKKAAKVTELGGNVCVPPTDIPNVGRFCVINDPAGPTLSMIQIPDAQPGPQVMAWNECMTPDGGKSRAFYEKLFGWNTEDMPMGEHGNYVILKNGECGIGGIMEMKGPQFEGVPPHWLNYINTTQVDVDAKKVEEAGGKLVVPPMDIPNNIGRFCVFADPGGGHIAMYQYTPH